jgi:chromosome segregation ATPase
MEAGNKMDEQLGNQIADTAARMAAAVEAMEKALERLAAQQEAIEQKVERIVAAIDEKQLTAGAASTETDGRQEQLAQLERENRELKAQAQRAMRKTLSPVVSMLLAKSGYGETGVHAEAATLDKILGPLSLEQRIAVKAEMARAGMIE